MIPVHVRLRSEIPEDERPREIREMVGPPWASDAGKFRGRDAPFATTVEGYAQWKKDCGDNGDGMSWSPDGKRVKRPEHLMNGRPCPEKNCTGKTVYAGHYCTRAGCVRSVEANDLVYAIKRNDLRETMRLFSICFGDASTISDVADFIVGYMFVPRER